MNRIYFREEKDKNLSINWRLLKSYMENKKNIEGLKQYVKDLAGPVAGYVGFNNSTGYIPYDKDSDYEIPLMPISVENAEFFDENGEIISVGSQSEATQLARDLFYEYYSYSKEKQLICYPVYKKDELDNAMITGEYGAIDQLHSGSRNKEDWQKYMVDGDEALSSEEDIYDLFDSDGELFACFQYKILSYLFSIISCACIDYAKKDYEKALEIFNETPFAKESKKVFGGGYPNEFFYEEGEIMWPSEVI